MDTKPRRPKESYCFDAIPSVLRYEAKMRVACGVDGWGWVHCQSTPRAGAAAEGESEGASCAGEQRGGGAVPRPSPCALRRTRGSPLCAE